MNFSEVVFYENYLTSHFRTNTVISRRVCLLVKMAWKTVIRPILPIRSTGTMWPNYLGTELVGTVFKFKNEMKNSSSCAPLDSVISHGYFSEEGKEIDQNS